MNVLLVEDDAVACSMLKALLEAEGHQVVTAVDGAAALGLWRVSHQRVIVADWLMPEMDGLELCRAIRAERVRPYVYYILQTQRTGKGHFLEAMEAGVDDFITKPIDPEEFAARLRVAERILGLREELYTLEGLLSICSYCKKIRDEDGRWTPIEMHLESRSDAEFSHGICPDCYDKYMKPLVER
jgi:phosphoserine phosphatase RsbU/P